MRCAGGHARLPHVATPPATTLKAPAAVLGWQSDAQGRADPGVVRYMRSARSQPAQQRASGGSAGQCMPVAEVAVAVAGQPLTAALRCGNYE